MQSSLTLLYSWFSWMSFPHSLQTPPMGVIISNHELIHISIIVGGNMSKCSPGRTPFGSPFHKQYKPARVQEGISIPSELLSRSSPLLVNRRCTPCKPAPSLSFPLQLGGRFLREVSRLISLRSTCGVGSPCPGCSGWPAGIATWTEPWFGPTCGCPAPAAGGGYGSRVLSPLLSSTTSL